MRSIKALGLAAVGALAAVVCMGVSSAPAAEPAKLCTVPAAGAPPKCPFGKEYLDKYVEAAILNPAQPAEFIQVEGGMEGKVTCNGVKAKGEFISNGEGSITSADFLNSGKPECPSTFFSEPAVEVSALNIPYESSVIGYLGAAAPQGELEVLKDVSLKLRVFTMVELICTYVPETTFVGKYTNPTETADAKLEFKGSMFKKQTGGMLCPTKGEFNATYKTVGFKGAKVWVTAQ